MFSVHISSSLRQIIRSERKKFNKKSSFVSHEIGKSTSYISQLEKGNFANIDFMILLSIFNTIAEDASEDFDQYLHYLFSNLLKDNRYDLTKEEWALTLYGNFIYFGISEQIISDLKCKFELFPAGSSIDLKEDTANIPPKGINRPLFNISSDGLGRFLPPRAILQNKVQKICNGAVTTTNYLDLLLIYCFYHSQTDQSSYKAYTAAVNELEILGVPLFFGIDKRAVSKIPSNDIFYFPDAVDHISTRTFERESEQLLDEFSIVLQKFNIKNPHYTRTQIEILRKNLKICPSFMFALLSFPFFEKVDVFNEQQEKLLKELLTIVENS